MRLAKAHGKKATPNPTVMWVCSNVMKICMQAFASGSLFDPDGDAENVAALKAAGLHR